MLNCNPLRPTGRAALLGLALTWTAGAAGAQTTWYVDDDAPGDPGPGNPFISDPLEDGTAAHPFDRIQEGIDAGMDGDEVLVLEGLYFDLDTIDVSSGMGASKALWIHSLNGPAVTTVDGAHLDSQVMKADSGESALTVIEGLTIMGGNPGTDVGDNGGGMVVFSSSPTFKDCVFTGNTARIGGGIYIHDSDSIFRRCQFTANYVSYQGGALYIDRGHTTFQACTFDQNDAGVGGGGIIVRGVASSSVTVRRCDFVANTTGGTGGGLHKSDSGALLIERTRFVGNTAAGPGGGLFVYGGGTARNCLFNGNHSEKTEGGGLTMWTGAPAVVENSTFVNNTGNGIWVHPSASGSVVNSILWNNFPLETSGNVSVSYSDVMGGNPGNENVDAYPLFADELGLDGQPGTLDDDFRLLAGSPCIDEGNTLMVSALAPVEQYPLDFDGKPRVADDPDTADGGVAVLGLTVDMGTHEYQPPPCSYQVAGPRYP